MSETIIIESNRQIAYNQQKEAIKQGGIESEKSTTFPNNKWTTTIPDGLQIHVNDEIQVEAIMLNSIGGGDDVMEFSGEIPQSKTHSYLGVDNESFIETNFYINDRNQFNIKLPKKEHLISYDTLEIGYGGPDLSTYESFRKCYYVDKLEGVYWDNSPDTPLWKPITGDMTAPSFSAPSVQKPPRIMNFISNKKFFLMNENYAGSYILNPTNRTTLTNQTANRFSKTIDFSAPVGFNVPGALGEHLTAQFHERDGNADRYAANIVEGGTFQLEGATANTQVVVFTPTPTITDQTLLSVPTTTGDLLFGRQNGTWPVKFKGEGPTNVVEGTGYTATLGRQMFNRFLLKTDPLRFEAESIYHSLKARQGSITYFGNGVGETEGSIYTGYDPQAITGINGGVGNFGQQLVYFDIPETTFENRSFNTKTNVFEVFTGLGTFTPVNNTAMWDMVADGLIATNIPYHLDNIDIINQVFRKIEVPNTELSVDFGNQEFKDSFEVQLDMGETNDSASSSTNNEHMFLQSPFAKYSVVNTLPLPNSYQDQGRTKIGPNLVNSGTTYTSIDTNTNNFKAYPVNVRSRFNPDMNISQYRLTPANNPYTLHASSMWEIDYSLDTTLSLTYDIAVIPIKMKAIPAQLYGLIGVSFCAYINKRVLTGSLRMPAPFIGEFFGISRSLFDNPTCKVASTQKTSFVVGSDKKRYYPNTAAKSQVFDYAPFCYIGADNPTLEFDGDNSKFAFKGLHMSVRSGNGVFPEWQQHIAPEANTDPTKEVISINDNTANFCYMSSTAGAVGSITPFQDIKTNQALSRYSLAQGGVAVDRIGYYDNVGTKRYNFTAIPENYEGTLFHKLGFDIEQLIPFFGRIQGEFNRSNYNKFIGLFKPANLKLENMVKPFTTNAYVSASINPGVVVNTTDNPMENLGIILPTRPAITNGESDELIAINLPKKLDFPYLILYSNLVENSKYYGGPDGYSKIPAMAYIPRSFTTGDYFFGTASTWSYTADRDYTITEILTDIRLPDGTPAPLAENSAVIFKITRGKIIPTLLIPGENKVNNNTEKFISNYLEQNNTTDNTGDNYSLGKLNQ